METLKIQTNDHFQIHPVLEAVKCNTRDMHGNKRGLIIHRSGDSASSDGLSIIISFSVIYTERLRFIALRQ